MGMIFLKCVMAGMLVLFDSERIEEGASTASTDEGAAGGDTAEKVPLSIPS